MSDKSSNVDEDPEESLDEFLDWLAWVWATEGERFYPPDETAKECIEAVDATDERKKGWEVGQHTRAWSTAVDRYQDLVDHGFNPKARAQREIERSREEGLDLPGIDWEWWDNHKRKGYDE